MAKRRLPKSEFSKASVPSEHVVPLVANGALAGPVADGRLFPVLVVDISGRADIAELVRVHRFNQTPGDVDTLWGVSRTDLDTVFLSMSFKRPVAAEVVLLFSMERQGILVESILETQGLYLQPGRLGYRFRDSVDAPKVLVEVTETGFRAHWDRLLLERMALVLSKQAGVTLRAGRELAREHIAEIRKLTRIRVQP